MPMRKFLVRTMKIISTVALRPEHRAAITQAVPGAELLDREVRSREEFSDLVSGGCDVLLTFRIPHDAIGRAPGIRWIQLLSAGAGLESSATDRLEGKRRGSRRRSGCRCWRLSATRPSAQMPDGVPMG